MRQQIITAVVDRSSKVPAGKRQRGAVMLAVAAAAAAITISVPASAATKTWTAASSGIWSTAANWGGAAPAATGDTVNITDTAAGIKTVTFDGAASTTSMAGLTVGGTTNTYTGQMTLAFPGGSAKIVAVTGITSIGGSSSSAGARGTIQQDGGTFNNSTLNIGGVAQGFYNLTAGTLTATTEIIASTATGTASFTQTGGTHTVTSSLSLANDPLGVATYALGGGTLVTSSETIGNLGAATVNQTGGVHNTSSTLLIGQQAGSSGTYTLAVGTMTSPNQTWGNAGSGSMTQSSGTNTVSGAAGTDSLLIGAQSTAMGVYTLNGGSVSVTAAGGAVIGKAGNGSLNQNGGTFSVSAGRDISIGTAAGGVGSYTLAGASTLSAGGNVYVGGTSAGAGGAGSLFIGGATATIAGTLKIWNANGSNVTLSGGTLNVASLDTNGNSSNFGWNTGALNITGAGGVTIGTNGPLAPNLSLAAGQALGVTGTTVLSAGTVLSMNGGSFTGTTLTAGAGSIAFSSGSFNLSSGGLVIDANGPMGSSVALPVGSAISVGGTLTNSGVVALTGGTIGGSSALNNNSVLSGTGAITGGGGISNTGLIALVGGNLTIAKAGVFQNAAGGIVQLDIGKQLQLNGGDLQNAGTLDLSGGGTLNSTSGASIINTANGLITGMGTIAVPLQNAGTIAVATGGLNVTGAFSNTGIIRLGAISSTLTVGGAGVTNSAGGTIQGVGRVSAALNNSGYVEAVGGTLQLAGATSNAASGTLASGAGTQILLTGVPSANLGTISLTGGSLNTNSQPLTNSASGLIDGFGTLRTGGAGLTNNGLVQLSGGSTNVYGAVTSSSGSKIIVSGGATATFYNPVTMNAGSEFRVSTASTAVFFGSVTGQANFTGTGIKDFESGVSALSAVMSSGSTIVQQGATLTAGAIREGALTVNGQVTITPDGSNAGTSKVGALALASGAKMDLSNNKLIVAGGDIGTWNGSSYTGVAGSIRSGRNGGTWNGAGILTSQALAASGNLTTIGVATADQLSRAGGTFGGLPVDSGDVLVAYTYGGDANLDGKINVDDYTRIDFNVPLSTNGWYNGDFNYDGKINVDDYTIIDFNVGIQGAPLGGSSASSGLSVVAVPEPGSAGLLLSAVGYSLTCATRRRRR